MTKQLNDRLQKEGVKTHKERVEELNKYLSKLSEHHDMYVLYPFLVQSIAIASMLRLCVY
jgi:protein FAM32A